MKTKTLLASTLITLFALELQATDRCVAENGTGGCFSSITAAITAAVDGDRIIIAPKAGNAPYVENLAVNKSLEFHCNTEGSQFVLQGNVTITPVVDRIVTFIGMNVTAGNITASAASPAGPRCVVNIMSCTLGSGFIGFDTDNFNVSVVSTVLSDGYVAIRYGKVIGNDITTVTKMYANGSSIYIGSDITPTLDSLLIIGNKVKPDHNLSFRYIIHAATSNQFLYIANNFVATTIAGTYSYGIIVTTSKNSASGKNTIINNTINFSTSSTNLSCIYLASSPANAAFDILNNVVQAFGGIGVNSVSNTGPIGLSFNYMNDPLTITGITNNGTNKTNSNTVLNSTTGKPNAGSDAINGGSSDEAYYDIDLTRNDAGAYGGSFTLDNYFPITGSARVYHVQAPRKVTLGTNIEIKASSFDR